MPRTRKNQFILPQRPGIEVVGSWMASRGWEPWPFQQETWQAYRDGRSGLVQVATGAGKTYAAFLGPLSDLIDELRATGDATPALSILYVTPLRAVSRDVEMALRQPIEDLRLPFLVESRTGDTKASLRQKQRERLPHVLITTPESLCLLLTRPDAASQMSHLRCLILDEWHELMASKRGTQVELAAARLRRFSPRMRTWGLSATLANLDHAARAAVGATEAEPKIVRGNMSRDISLRTVFPGERSRLPWVGHLGLTMLPDVVEALDPAKSTIIFTNTRSQSERWFSALLAVKPQWNEIMALHHGSLDRKERERVEAGLKHGYIRIVVATSSLDLGVDFGPVERVVQIGSPKGIARIMQRAGRASHRPNASTEILCVPTYAMELIEIAAARDAVVRGEIEPRWPFEKPLDVLAQHLVTCGLGGGFTRASILQEVREAFSYRTLTERELDWTLELVTHGGGTLKAYPEFHKLQQEGEQFAVQSSRIATLHRLNIGTITADTTLEIRYVRGRSLGRIEENFISGLREGDAFVYAGKALTFAYLQDLVAYVRPSRSKTTFTPIWGGTRLPISESLSASIRRRIGMFREGVFSDPESEAFRPLAEIQARESMLPQEDELLVEITRTSEGDHCCVFAFEGRLVNAGLGALLALRLSRRQAASFSVSANDYGVELFTPAGFDFSAHAGPDLFSREQILEDALTTVNESELMKTQFREIARVSGMVMQTYPGSKKTGRQVGASSSLLFDVLREFDPGNLLLEQARREVLERQFERSRLSRTFDRVAQSRLVVKRTARPTPLSFPILIERLATRLSSESIQDRIERMKAQWTQSEHEAARTEPSFLMSIPHVPAKPSSSRRSKPRTGPASGR